MQTTINVQKTETNANLKALLPLSSTKLGDLLEGAFEKYSYKIDCSQMKQYQKLITFEEDCRDCPLFKPLFDRLNTITGPALYWFEADSEEEAYQLKADLDQFRKINPQKKQPNWRNIPAQNNNSNSKVVYVGIRQGGYTKKHSLSFLAGRIIIHLGYYKHGSTQGLQLAHWAKLPLTLNVIALPDQAKDYLNILEKLFALELNPLVGKH